MPLSSLEQRKRKLQSEDKLAIYTEIIRKQKTLETNKTREHFTIFSNYEVCRFQTF